MDPVAILGADEIARRIPDGATVAVTGSGIFLEADVIFAAIERSFLESGHPRNLTIVHALGVGDGARSGMNRFAHEGLTAKVIGGHWSWSAPMQRLAREEKLAAYSFPAGVISSLLREIGAGRPGLITRIGLGTFVDPRLDGGRCNARATESLVELVSFDGREFLRYKPFRVDVALVRGTEIDPRGNVSFAREPADLDASAVALAAHASGGRVYVQTEARRTGRILPARLARLPGILVDAACVAPDARRTYLDGYQPRLSGEASRSGPRESGVSRPPSGARRIIAERALEELGDARSVNFGFGVPGAIPALLRARGGPAYWGTVEQGIHNGEMLDGPMFGAAFDPDAIIPSVDQFDFYSGGGIDIAFLGMAEFDERGDVNVSMIDGQLVGPGGFIDITQTARKVVFCGAFEAKGLDARREPDGRIRILRHGAVPKLVKRVRHVTFSGAQARSNGQEVRYVTERAVFRLGEKGIELTEVAAGIDPERDVLSRMPFEPPVVL